MKTLRILIVGVGGQGVILCSNVLAAAAVKAGADVKKSEVHGMAQRGGSVTTHVVMGDKIASPLVEEGRADMVLALNNDEIERVKHYLAPHGVAIPVPDDLPGKLKNPRTINIAMLGLLSRHMDLPEEIWHEAIKERVKEKFIPLNIEAFAIGRQGLLPIGE